MQYEQEVAWQKSCARIILPEDFGANRLSNSPISIANPLSATENAPSLNRNSEVKSGIPRSPLILILPIISVSASLIRSILALSFVLLHNDVEGMRVRIGSSGNVTVDGIEDGVVREQVKKRIIFVKIFPPVFILPAVRAMQRSERFSYGIGLFLLLIFRIWRKVRI